MAVGSIAALTVVEGRSGSVDVASSFSDPDADPLSYGAASSDAGIATVSTSDSEVTVTGVAAGSAAVTVTATDTGGLSAISEFAVTVEEPGQPAEPLFDSLMVEFTEKQRIGAAALGIMKDGVVVYDRAFGWMDRDRAIPIRQDVMMRLASVTKPITAAAIHELVRDGALELDAFVFDLGQPGGGLLDVAPFPSLGDVRLREITVRHLLMHRGGWDRDAVGDLAFREIEIAQAMSIPSPPGRRNTVRYILGQPLQFDPGSQHAYSNVGYMVLGLVIEEVSGNDYMDHVLEAVLAPLGIRSDDVIRGRTFPKDRDEREPWYDDDRLTRNVFDPGGPRVRWPDGGWDHEAKVGHGGLVTSTRPMLSFLDVYQVAGDDIGTRRRRGAEPFRWRWNHTGSLPGTDTVARQRWDGVNYVVLFNRRLRTEPSYKTQIRDLIDDILDNTRIDWPEPRRAVWTATPPSPPGGVQIVER